MMSERQQCTNMYCTAVLHRNSATLPGAEVYSQDEGVILTATGSFMNRERERETINLAITRYKSVC